MSSHKAVEKKKHKLGKSKNEASAKKQLVLKEIKDLSGDEDDYELIAGIDSDEDDTAPVKVKSRAKDDVRLAKDLKKLSKELGLLRGGFIEQITVDDDQDEEPSPEDLPVVVPVKAKQSKKAGHQVSQPILEPAPQWHDVELPHLEGVLEDRPEQFIINRELEKAKQLLALENEYYSTSEHVKSSDRQFLSTIMRSGTLNDRVSALTLVVQESPLHAMKSMDALMLMCKKKSRNEAVSAVGAVKDLMQGSVLPSRKLVYFADQPGLGAKDATDIHLMYWAFEDYLKRYYFDLLGVMEALSLDPLPFPRNHMVRYFFELLKDKAEQEANLLRLLVNKLGDKDKKIASKCSHYCLQLMQAHPLMVSIIVNGLEQVLFNPSISSTAQYYVIITLNQTILSSNAPEVPNHLIEVYFTYFTKLINESEKARPIIETSEKKNKKAMKKERLAQDADIAEEELNSKMISAVLTGVNRAFPFSNLEDNVFEKNLDTLYKITHSSNFNTSIQALILLHQVSIAKEASADRFYRTLYESINDPRLLTSSKQALYLNLLFKALKSDKNQSRTKAFVKRLVQSTTMHSPPFICALLFLLSELEMAVPAIREIVNDKKSTDETKAYDGRARDPRFANAESTKLWEILPLLNHYHPSVSLFARSWLTKTQMPSKPDLSLHTLSHFLDRFVYRNAKTKAQSHGGSIMQPQAGGDTRGLIMAHGDNTQEPVNSEQFYRQSIHKVAPDEIFFYKYFSEKMSKPTKRKRSSKEDIDEDDVWQALVQSKPEVEGPSDDESIEDLSDLEAMSSDEEPIGELNDAESELSTDEEAEFDEPDFETDVFAENEDDLIPSDTEKPAEKKRKKTKLPAFASADEYLHLIDG